MTVRFTLLLAASVVFAAACSTGELSVTGEVPESDAVVEVDPAFDAELDDHEQVAADGSDAPAGAAGESHGATGTDDAGEGDEPGDGDAGDTGASDIDAGDSGDPSGDAVRQSAPDWEPEPIEWQEFNSSVDFGFVEVPVDYDDPDGPTIELYLARRNADDPDSRIGSLIVNPGGPGFGGSDFALFAGQIYDRELLEHFDIVGFDPRGTGLSEPAIDCVDDLDPYVTGDVTPQNEAEAEEIAAIAQEFADACAENNATVIQHVGTNNSARDIDSIRRALGEDQISYFGFSYGSELGGTWATLFPDTVRAAVLDGASDPNADSLESTKQQLAGFEASLTTFLARCSANESCAFHNDGDAEGAYDELLAALDESPLPVEADRPAVNQTVAITATAQAMYSESFWLQLEQALAAAQEGDGTGLLRLNDAYFQRQVDGSFGNELEAFQVISCADTIERPSREELLAASDELTAVAPRLNPEGSEGYFCTFFPPALDPRVEITGDGAGPIVVIGTTGDPATPFESTVRMANTLQDGRLVIVDADQHTGYGVNRCVVEVVNRYLVDLEAPDDETECA